MMGRGFRLALVSSGLLLLVDAVMVVDPAQVAMVYRFGAAHRVVQAGLSFRLPWPLERDERVATTEVRRVELPQKRYLTGDHNLVDLGLVVQYAVGDPKDFVVHTDDGDALLGAVVEAATTHVVGSLGVDLLLTTGRSSLQEGIQREAQASLDSLRAGIRLVAVDARNLSPPSAVVAAFNDVSSARGDRETIALAASAYASKLLPDTRGRASQVVEEARADASETRSQASSQVARFRGFFASGGKNRDVAMERVHDDTVGLLAPRLKVIVAPPGTQIVLPEASSP